MEEESKKELTIDQLLERQSTPKFLATVEAIPNDSQMVKVTPWSREAGCQCHSAINVPKESIKSVVLTGDTHSCCGKSLSVVEINFQSGATVDLNQLFAQMAAKPHPQIEQQHHHHGELGGMPGFRMPSGFGPGSLAPDPRFAFARPNPECVTRCGERYAQCVVDCIFGPDGYGRCECLCRNQYCACYTGCGGRCLPTICPP